MLITLTTILTSLMLISGAAVMAANVMRFRSLIHRHRHLKECATGLLNRIFTLHKVLMVFFLFGYVAVFVATVSEVPFVSETLVGVIFLAGAVFVALSIEVQHRMLKEARENYFRAIRMLVRAVEIRDPYTMGHSEHVANLSMLLHAHLPAAIQKEIDGQLLHSTALMHDIGKIGVPERVLNKPGRLTEDEWDLIRRHTTIGKDLLSKMAVCSSVPEWVVYHHERIDGGGYHGLAGKDIPIAARLLAVTDTFSAIVTDRPYRRGKTYSDAVGVLQANAGSQLDRDIVEAFCKIAPKAVESCRPQALVLDFLKEIEKLEQFRELGVDATDGHAILSAAIGERWLRHTAGFCRKHGTPLTVAALRLGGLAEVERAHGYHIVDEYVGRIGSLLIDNTRSTDVVVHSRRDFFLLALPECEVDQAANLLDRIRNEILDQLDEDGMAAEISLSRELVSYHPDHQDSWGALSQFVESHFNDMPEEASAPRRHVA